MYSRRNKFEIEENGVQNKNTGNTFVSTRILFINNLFNSPVCSLSTPSPTQRAFHRSVGNSHSTLVDRPTWNSSWCCGILTQQHHSAISTTPQFPRNSWCVCVSVCRCICMHYVDVCVCCLCIWEWIRKDNTGCVCVCKMRLSSRCPINPGECAPTKREKNAINAPGVCLRPCPRWARAAATSSTWPRRREHLLACFWVCVCVLCVSFTVWVCVCVWWSSVLRFPCHPSVRPSVCPL